ncbi:MAG TPA: PD-(D/E)XK nuclease family protein, partial [Streptosporangiaceae bacterium]
MNIPPGKSGHPTISATGLRAYGAGGFMLDEQEEPRGCPRKYQARYVHGVPDEPTERMEYGKMFHRVLELAETEPDADPYEILTRVFPADMDPARMVEARRDLDAYLARESSP